MHSCIELWGDNTQSPIVQYVLIISAVAMIFNVEICWMDIQ